MTTPAPDNPAPSPTPPDPRPPRRPGRRWRRFKWGVRLVVGVPLLLLTVGLVLMRSPMVGRVVRGQVERLTGGEWHARHAAVMLNGQLIVSDLHLRAPSIPGPAGELLSASQAVIDVDWWQLAPLKWLSNEPPGPIVRAVRVAGPVFRLSQSTEDGSISLAALTPPATSASVKTALPRIDVIDGRIEFTEHSAKSGRYEELAIIPIAGALMPAPDGRPSFSVRLQEIGRSPSISGERRGMVLDGRVDLAAGDATLKLLNLSFDAWPAESVPSQFRDLWRRLALQGAVRQTVFDYTQKAGLSVSILLDDVALTVPVPSEGAGGGRGGDDGFLSLRGVKGSINLSTHGLEADLTGKLGQQDGLSQMRLSTRGLDLNSGFRCEITGRDINVTEEATFLPYVPPIVRQYLRWFGGPTAVVDASVTIARGDPVDGRPAEVTVPEGRMTFQNGRAAFHKFPYPFHDMAGEVTFDDTTIRIVRITGVGPKGSPLTATGLITPLTEDAQVDVKVDVNDVPVDDELLAAMRPTYRRLMEVLFSRPQYDALVAKGLVRDPAGAENAVGPRGGSGGATTPFEFGGRGRVHVHLQRPLGEHVEWTTQIGVEFDRAGLVPEPFPFPIEARDLAIEVNDERTILKGGRFSGLHGGTAAVAATVRFGDSAADPVDPEVRITSTDVPVDELLLNAVPGEEPAAGGAIGNETDAAGTGLSAKGILRRLDLRGRVDCEVELSAAAEAPVSPTFVGPPPLPSVSYAVEVHLGKMTAAPVAALASVGTPGPDLCIRELEGSVRVTEGRVTIDGLRAGLGRIGPDRAGAGDGYAHAAPAGQITLRLDAETTPARSADQGRLHAELQLDGLNLADSFEPAVRVFSADAADFLAGVKKSRRPDGVIDALVTLDSPHARKGAPVEIGVEVTRAQSVGLALLDGRLELSEPRGRVRVATRDHRPGARSDLEGETVRFDSVAAKVGFNGAPAGSFRIDGTILRDPESGGIARAEGLVCGLSGWTFESGLTRAIVSRVGGGPASEALSDLEPRGEFDASVALSGGPGLSMLSGWVEPRSLKVVRAGVPIVFDRVGGRLSFRGHDDGGVTGSVERGELATSEWSARGGADWVYSPEKPGVPGRVDLDAAFTGSITALGAQWRSVLPGSATRSLDKLSLNLGEPAKITEARIRASMPVSGPTAGEAHRVEFDGTIAYAGLSGDVGVPFKDARGEVRVHVAPPEDAAGEGDADQSPSPLRVRIDGPSMRIAGVQLGDYRLTLDQTAPGRLTLTDATASCHGGRVFARGGAEWTSTDRGPGPGRMRLDTLIAGVNFAPLLDDLNPSSAPTPTDASGDGADGDGQAPAGPEDSTRGTLDARVAIESVEGEPDSLRGCGAIRIAHGDVLSLPLILPLMEVSNLMAPSNDPLDYMQATFYLRGREAVFDDISVLSDSLAIVGSGRLTLPGMGLDMRFNSKSNRRVPILSDAFEAIRDEIASTVVTGTVEHPVVRSEPLTTTRRMIGDIFSPGRPRWNGPPADAARRERERLMGE